MRVSKPSIDTVTLGGNSRTKQTIDAKPKKKKTRTHLVQLNICSLQLDALHEHRESHRMTEWVRLEEGTARPYTPVCKGDCTDLY